MHPLGGRELYRVAWLILGLASGCLLSPRYVLLPPTTFRFFPIASSLLSIVPSLSCLTTYLESRAQHTSRRFPIIFIFCHHFSFDRETTWIFLGKKRKTFIFVPPRFRKGILFRFPFAFSRIHGFSSPYGLGLLFLTFPFSRENHPSTFWHGAHSTTSSCVAADS